ncbi:MAG: hypothetical protein F2581_06000 [Actinobacteria bacterium]|uniref:Unannotated protein n=1 Tax=freshwater metagenome TaxID=449393 RepID=A0A6J6GZ44_9ZZZZ|nr:hypothetical protein [Actinomycetota bacterium]
MEVALIRHAIPIRKELVSGVADPELSADGCAQAQLLADYLSKESFDALYASPMKRAQQTAQAVSSALNLPLIIIDGVADEATASGAAVKPPLTIRATGNYGILDIQADTIEVQCFSNSIKPQDRLRIHRPTWQALT